MAPARPRGSLAFSSSPVSPRAPAPGGPSRRASGSGAAKFGLAGVANGVASTLTIPFDVVKTRMQVQHEGADPVHGHASSFVWYPPLLLLPLTKPPTVSSAHTHTRRFTQ